MSLAASWSKRACVVTVARLRRVSACTIGVAMSFRVVASVVLTLVLCLASAEAAPAASWVKQPVPQPAGSHHDSVLTGVSCSSATACTAVGSFRTRRGTFTLAERWSGRRWMIQRTPNAVSRYNVLRGVSCTSKTSCTAVGFFSRNYTLSTLVERWDGSRWAIQRTLPNVGGREFGDVNGAVLDGVSCTSKSACTAVGAYGYIPPQATLVERWNGKAWSRQRIAKPHGSELTGVSCPAQTTCFAVGSWSNSPPATRVPGRHYFSLFGRWNAGRWSIHAGGDQGPQYLGVSCVSNAACMEVGGAHLKHGAINGPPSLSVALGWHQMGRPFL